MAAPPEGSGRPVTRPTTLDNPLARKLGRFIRLSETALGELSRIIAKTYAVGRDTEIIVQGQPCNHLSVLVKGGAIRYKLLPDGRRQVVSFIVPGDFIGVGGLLFERASSSVITLETCELAPVDLVEFHWLCQQDPFTLAAIFWDSAIEQTMLAERLVTLGRRTAQERVAFLLLELWERLQLVGLATRQSFTYPLSQHLMADALGLSVVHVNRTLKRLERQGLVTIQRHIATIRDMAALKAMADFEEGYIDRFKPSRRTESAFALHRADRSARRP